jgi:hypothetical protein
MPCYKGRIYPLGCASMIVLSYCSKVLPYSFRIVFYLTHPTSSNPIRHNDIRIEQPGLQFRTSMRKQEGPTTWGPALKNGSPFHRVVRSLCSRLAWSRTRKPAHSTAPVTGTLVFGAISPVGLTTWGPKLEKRHLSPRLVRSRVAAQPGPIPWACMLHHSVMGVLVPRTTIQGVWTHNLAPPD